MGFIFSDIPPFLLRDDLVVVLTLPFPDVVVGQDLAS
jgi:hypothetical protein